MPTQLGDDPGALAVQTRLLREMTPATRARLANELTLTANRLALAGLRQRFPGAPERESARNDQTGT